MRFRLYFLLYFFFSVLLSYAQNSDSTFIEKLDSLRTDTAHFSQTEYDDLVYKALPDSSPVVKRSFSAEKIKTLKDDPDLNYKVAPTVGESLWERFLLWLSQILDEIFRGAVNTNWGRVTVYILGFALLIVLIMMMLKVNAFKVLYSGQGTTQKYQVLDENIHEMDFDQLIQDAITRQDYRKGIRLLFLYALKLLSDKHLIYWKSGKTNHEYVSELHKSELKSGFNELSFYFDYAWYGNFKISQETFQKVHETFADWKNKLS